MTIQPKLTFSAQIRQEWLATVCVRVEVVVRNHGSNL